MPGLEVLLKHVMRKYDVLADCSIGVYYGEFKKRDDVTMFSVGGKPLEGWLNDPHGNATSHDYIIRVNEDFKYAPNLVKVGVIANAVSYIGLREKIIKETKGAGEIRAALFGYKDPKFEDAEEDARSRGFTRPMKAAGEYIDGIESVCAIEN